MTESFSLGHQASSPAASIAWPPMPAICAPGKRSRSARTRPAPSRSPEASPATIAMRGADKGSLSDQRAFAALDEVEHQLDVGRRLRRARQLLARARERQAGLVERLVGAL